MYGLLSIIFFIAALFTKGDMQLFIGIVTVSALYAIAAGLSSIYTYISEQANLKNQEK